MIHVSYQISIFVMLIAMIICAVTDIRKHKIYNFVTFPLIIFGLIFGPDVLYVRILWVLFLFILGMFSIIGLGDIKLWMGMGTVMGVLNACYSMMAACIFFIAILSIFDKKDRMIIYTHLKNIMLNQKPHMITDEKPKPFAPYMLAGFCAYNVIYFFFLK